MTRVLMRPRVREAKRIATIHTAPLATCLASEVAGAGGAASSRRAVGKSCGIGVGCSMRGGGAPSPCDGAAADVTKLDGG